jgi:serine/threonine-protein kinase RsbT
VVNRLLVFVDRLGLFTFVRTAAVSAELSLVDQTELVTAASELARNTLVYGGGGTVEVSRVDNGRRPGIRIVFADLGPASPTSAWR